MMTLAPRREGGRRPASAGKGFTLMEVLTVITIIAILLTVASVGIQRIDRGQANTSALAVAEALFDEARSMAIGQGTEARVLIHGNLDDSDELDRERYLRYLCVAVPDESGQYRVVSRGTLLPSGVYFSPGKSRDAAGAVGDLGEFGEMSIQLPGDPGAARQCYFYEFNAEGICVIGDAERTGAAFVLVGGSRQPGKAEPEVMGNNKSGFVIWRNGRTSLFRSPNQI